MKKFFQNLYLVLGTALLIYMFINVSSGASMFFILVYIFGILVPVIYAKTDAENNNGRGLNYEERRIQDFR